MNRHRMGRWKLRQMGYRSFALEPIDHVARIDAESLDWCSHVNANRAIDRTVTDAEAKDHPPVGRVGNQGGMLRAEVRMAQIDVGNPASHPDGLCCRAHQLNGG